MYAGRKRRKPVQRTVKQPPAEGVKSNPSKRHRDRLNSELDRLASLLPFPEEVTSSLDKLSILRLSVSYLRAKNFFTVALKKRPDGAETDSPTACDSSRGMGSGGCWVPEGELLLQALNGFVLVITAEGVIFYSSHTIQDYLGFHQTDVMHLSVFELIHTEDQQEFRRNLHWALNPPSTCGPEESPPGGELITRSSLVNYKPDQLPPENSSFLERSFVCRFRCLLDNSSGFLALNLQGRLKFLHGQNGWQDDGKQPPPQLALFAIATPLQPPSILEIRTKNMIFRTKHKLDFTPMACDAKGKLVLGYTEAELRVRGSGYQFIHAADMLYCAENHIRMIKTGESGLTVFRLLTKANRWKWVQANARLVYRNGRPDYIIATQRPLTEEEGGEHLQSRSMQHPFTFATGEALLYQTSHPIPCSSDPLQGAGHSSKPKKGKAEKSLKDDLDPSSLLGALMRQDGSVYVCQPAVVSKLPIHSSLFSEHSESEGISLPSAGESWSAVPKSVTDPHGEQASFDPLLTTLDSLSLEGEDNCSSSELFSALETLGLSAEDLELLLLDERMIQVEMDPDYIPSLSDLLTNNEILTYIHDSLESRTEGGSDRAGSCPPFPFPRSQGTEEPAQNSSTPPPQALATQYPPYRPHKQAPIVELSQQMQQHLSAQVTEVKDDTWSQQVEPQVLQLQHSSLLIRPLTQPMENGLQFCGQPLHNGHWGGQNVQMSVELPEGLSPVTACQPEADLQQPEADLQQPEADLQQPEADLQQRLARCLCQRASSSATASSGAFHPVSQPVRDAPQWQGCGCAEQVSLAVEAEPCPARLQTVDYCVTEAPSVALLINGATPSDSGGFQGTVATVSCYQMLPPKSQHQTNRTQLSSSIQDTSLQHILGIVPPQQRPPWSLMEYSPPHFQQMPFTVRWRKASSSAAPVRPAYPAMAPTPPSTPPPPCQTQRALASTSEWEEGGNPDC
ncbi:LOW QUALITY PROTEIN: aryl hydrocarbon receptor-like [Megalops cyprinoides]|uniref:LOW QUALITY PROTEIN: aryl hydrocarbon receptor-like n=1 Tax=Megalops cyprinoides TaxID=118141 RepID=UPI00186480AC|nr:LOW QUALITY PROTEIN: aryl hydrocarbon receptor-like [Megalops cyprinoides]